MVISLELKSKLLWLTISSLIFSATAIFLTILVPKPETIPVLWEYLTTKPLLYYSTFITILLSMGLIVFTVFTIGKTYFEYFFKDSHNYGYESCEISKFIHITAVVVCLLFVVLASYLVKYLWLFSLIPLMCAAVLWGLTSDRK